MLLGYFLITFFFLIKKKQRNYRDVGKINDVNVNVPPPLRYLKHLVSRSVCSS